MSRIWIVVVCSVLALSASPALAQSGLPGAMVDVGVDVSAAISGGPAVGAISPRLTFNPAPDLALAIRLDAVGGSAGPAGSTRRSQRFVLELHRTLAQRGPVALEGIVGGGLHRGTRGIPAFSYRTGAQVVDVPAQVLTNVGPAWLLGIGATQRMAGSLRLREDVRLAIHDDGPDFLLSIGVAAPIGRDVTRRAGQSARIGSTTLRTGRRVWITDDNGRTIGGVVGDVDANTIEVLRQTGRESIDVAHARRIDVPDSIGDGIRNGILIGAAGFGVYGAVIASAICECDDLETAAGLTILFAGMGAGGGALIGALSDSLHVGRRPILDRSTGLSLSITPVVGRSRAGALAALRW